MRAIVAFDSFYGNTRKVAEMIAAELISRGHQAELVNVRDVSGKDVAGDALFLGSPTRMGRMTGKTKRFGKNLDRDLWRGKMGYPFDTIMMPSDDSEKKENAMKWVTNGAAPKISEVLKAKGLMVSGATLRLEVIGMKGPLAPNSLEVIKSFLDSELPHHS